MEDVVEKIKDLLRLAQSANVNEAGNAAAAAQRLMEKYKIDQAMLVETEDAETADEPPTSDLLTMLDGSKVATWRSVLVHALARANQCKSFLLYRTDGVRGYKWMLVGRPRDAATMRYLYTYITREIDRLTEEASAERGKPGRTWCNNFRLGAANAVSNRLYEATKVARETAQEASGGGAALVRVNTALARIDDRWAATNAFYARMAKLHGLRSRGGGSGSTFDPDARRAGGRAGATIALSGAANGGALGAGARGKLRG